MLFALCLGVTAKENSDNAESKLSKKEQKAIEKRKKEIQDSIAHADAVEAIKAGVYILITDQTMSRKLENEDRPYNFVIVENTKILVQTGKARTHTGNNNLGGLTIMSDIVGDIKVEEKKNGEVKSKFRVIDEYLSGDINVKLDKKGNYGEINILDLKTGQYVTFLGNFLPFEPSLVGTAIEIGRLFTPEGWNAFSLGTKHDAGSLMDYLSGARSSIVQ